MKIAFIVPSLANTGPQIVVKDLCEGLVDLGHKCKIFYFDNIVDLDMPCDAEQIRFRQNIDLSDWNVVHSHMLRPDIWIFINKIRNKYQSVKFISTVHQNINETLSFSYNRLTAFVIGYLWKKILSTFDQVVVLTKEHINSIPQVRKSNIEVINNGRDVNIELTVDQSDAAKLNEFRNKYQTIICSNSLISKRKGLSQIINALPLMSSVGYLIIGDGIEKEILKDLAARLDVADQCLWLGFKKNGYRYLRYGDIYAIPSYSEGMPLSLIEAAAMSMPTICSDIAILRSIVNDDSVIFTPLDNTKQFTQSIKTATDSASTLSVNIRSHYEKNWTKEIMVNNYLNIYTIW